MTHSPHVTHLLPDYVDDLLAPAERAAVEAHLDGCPACRTELEASRRLQADLAALPREVAPPRDLWDGIAARLEAPVAPTTADFAARRNGQAPRPAPSRAPRVRVPRRMRWLAAGLAVVLVAGVGVWRAGVFGRASWTVVPLAGTPHVDGDALGAAGRLREGDWLVTGDGARARVDVGVIGHVEVEPGTRLRLRRAQPTDHRIALAEGRIEATISAPPRLFFVETPSALAVDLGCAYTLEVDSTGASVLHVTSGYVELAGGAFETVVPAGAMCVSRPGKGPGTPFDEDAGAAFRAALYRFDFEDGGREAISEVLELARPDDAITLWLLLFRTDVADQDRLYERLTDLVPPPPGVTREGVLAGDVAMLDAWREHLGMDLFTWWGFLGGKKKARPAAE